MNFLFLARHVSLAFGTDYGCCWVQLGGTIALAQVSAYLSEPATTRPNEGILRCETVRGPILSLTLTVIVGFCDYLILCQIGFSDCSNYPQYGILVVQPYLIL